MRSKVFFIVAIGLLAIRFFLSCTPAPQPALPPLEIVLQEWNEFREHYGRDAIFYAVYRTAGESQDIPDGLLDVQVSDPDTPLWDAVTSTEALKPLTFHYDGDRVWFYSSDQTKKVFIAWRD